MTRAQGSAVRYKCDQKHIIMDWEVTKTHTGANITLHTHTPSLMNEYPTDLTLILRFSVAGNFTETVSVYVSGCIIKPSSNIYWGQMGGRMLPVSAWGNEGSGGMMKRWACCCSEGHFTYNGNPESLCVCLSLSLPLWSPLTAAEDQRRHGDCFQSSFRWGGRSLWYLAEFKWN